jgi:hypothetical protein
VEKARRKKARDEESRRNDKSRSIDEERTCKSYVSFNTDKEEFPVGQENFIVYKIRVKIIK